MSIKVAINGFGRIGRLVFRVMHERGGFDVVAVNDLADAASLAHLLKYDSVHGRLSADVVARDGVISVDGRDVRTFSERDPAALPWGDLGVDAVVEATGVFRTRAGCLKHVEAGAKKVVLTVPAKDSIDAMVVLGVNDAVLAPEHQVISNASCTTNCLAPVAKVLHDAFGIERGFMTTIHAYTNDQRITDLIHRDMRRARAAAINIIPTTTGAARSVGKVIPELEGRLDGFAMRVPVPSGSCVDFVATLRETVDVEAVNGAFRAAAEGPMRGILGYTEDPIVSSDMVHDPRSSIVDGLSTMVMDGGKLLKTVSWYDNEWGYSNRVVDLLSKAYDLD